MAGLRDKGGGPDWIPASPGSRYLLPRHLTPLSPPPAARPRRGGAGRGSATVRRASAGTKRAGARRSVQGRCRKVDFLDEAEHFRIISAHRLSKPADRGEHFSPTRQASHGDLAEDERMGEKTPLAKGDRERFVGPPEMIDPDRAVRRQPHSVESPSRRQGRVGVAPAEARAPRANRRSRGVCDLAAAREGALARAIRTARIQAPPGDDYLTRSTCSNSSSTGVARPKMETPTFTLPRSKSSSSTTPLNEANGPSRTLTWSPIS